jgi:hypothetical protein
MQKTLKLPGLRTRIKITYNELPPSKKNANLFGSLQIEHLNAFHPPLNIPVGPNLHANLMSLFRDGSRRLLPHWLEEAIDFHLPKKEYVDVEDEVEI